MKELLVILFGIFGFDTIYEAGSFKKIISHYEGECSLVDINGAEDITVLNNGLALISIDDRRKTLAHDQHQGGIYSYNLNENSPQLVSITSLIEFEFHPHGISAFENSQGQIKVIAVNHRKNEHTLELFDYYKDSLLYIKTIRDPLLNSPNDLVLVDEDQFYITNDHGNSSNFGKILEDYFQLSKSNILYYDGSKFSVSASNLSYANGINISKDGANVYVAETVGKRISIFNRNIQTHELKFNQSINLDSGVDNIELDSGGNLWIGSHPKMLKFVKHAMNSKNVSPSQVIKISQMDNGEYFHEEIYLNQGSEISGSSAAAFYKNILLIGSVFEGFLDCRSN